MRDRVQKRPPAVEPWVSLRLGEALEKRLRPAREALLLCVDRGATGCGRMAATDCWLLAQQLEVDCQEKLHQRSFRSRLLTSPPQGHQRSIPRASGGPCDWEATRLNQTLPWNLPYRSSEPSFPAGRTVLSTSGRGRHGNSCLGYLEYLTWLQDVLPEGMRPEGKERDTSTHALDGLSGLELLRELGRLAAESKRPKGRLGGIPALTDEERELADKALGGSGSSREVLVSRFSVDLSREQVECLLPGTWLNDEVINFYYKLLQERSKKPGYPKGWFANSFFWPKLSGGSSHNEYSYKEVKRWTIKAKVDIFALDFVVFPMNVGETHWAMGAIDFKAKGFRYFDSMFCSPHRNFVPFLRQYLDDEHKAKKGGKSFKEADTWELLQETRPPQQKNGYDCGVFTCMFADYFTAGRELTFSQADMGDARLRIAARLMRGDEEDWWGDER